MAASSYNWENPNGAPVAAGDLPSGIDPVKLADASVSAAEFQRLDGVTGNLQTQIDGKLAASSTKLPPTPSGAGKIIYDNGTAYVALPAGDGYLKNTSGVLSWSSVSSFDPASPGAIGGTTPAAITGTTITATSSFSGPGTGLTSLPAAALSISGQTTGDLLYASSGSAFSRLADVATGQVLVSGGVGVAPAYSATPTVTTLTGSTSLLTPLLDRASAGTLAIGTTTATAITLAQDTTLAAGKSLSMAAGAGALSLGSGTGNWTMPTGAGAWSGASNKTTTFTASGTGQIQLKTAGGATSGAFLTLHPTIDSTLNYADNLILSRAGSTKWTIGTNITSSSAGNAIDLSGLSLDGNSITGVSGFYMRRGASNILDVGATSSTAVTMASGKTLTLDSGTATGSGLAVTLNKQVGVITTEALTTNAGVSETYTITNSLVTTASRIFCQGMGGTNTTPFDVQRAVPGTGSFTVKIFNADNGSTALNGTVVFSFLIL